MLPLNFNFVTYAAVGAAHQLKGALYRFKPGRTAAPPNWDNNGAQIQGKEIAAPMTDPSFWRDRFALCTLIFRKQDGDQLEMNDALVSVSRKKNIVTTQLVGMDGTVKEYVNADDYTVKIAVGVQAVRDGVFVDEYPTEGIKQLRAFFDLNEPIMVNSSFLEIFDIDRLVITDFSVEQATESNYQPLTLSALSDTEYNVYSTEY